MSQRHRYTLIPTRRIVPSLRGRTVRPRPLLFVGVSGPSSSAGVTGLLDPGSDDTVFPDAIAALLGLDLDQLPVIPIHRPGGQVIAVRYADVSLRLTDGIEFREWPAIVGFTSAALPYSLLGFAGFLEFFTATFRGDLEEVELAVNALYPGT